MFETKQMRRERQDKQWKEFIKRKTKECGAMWSRTHKRWVENINVMEILEQ